MFGQGKNNGKQVNGQVDTLIGRNTHVVGDIEFSGGLYVDGKVTGTIRAQPGAEAMLSISEHGLVEGDLLVPNVVVNGQLVGNIRQAQSVELLANGRIHGNVEYVVLQMSGGAAITGQLNQIREGTRQLTGPDAET